ncbi:rhodanese-like domain-containing protein [Halobacteriales archaeon Cl-PHB]
MDGEIQPHVLQEALETSDADNPLILDIRNGAHFAEGHLPNSRNVPLPELPQQIDEIADADHVVTVCPHGKASIKAARIVGAYRDFDGTVESLAGGLEAWEGPVERGDGESGGGETGPAPADEGPDAPF